MVTLFLLLETSNERVTTLSSSRSIDIETVAGLQRLRPHHAREVWNARFSLA